MRIRGGSAFMNDCQRDKLITETATDVKWLKQFFVEHKQTHAKYIWYLIGTVIAIGLSWFR